MVDPTVPRTIDKSIFQRLRNQKTFEPIFDLYWQVTVLPELVSWLQSFENKQGNQLNETIEETIQQLKDKFSTLPPFTLSRISEIIVNPEREGYKEDTNENIHKMINAIDKLVSVTSTLFDYPQPH